MGIGAPGIMGEKEATIDSSLGIAVAGMEGSPGRLTRSPAHGID
jgi:hypothetical protein